MINHVWSVLCGRSVIDSETNNITLIDVLEQLQAKGRRPPEGGSPAVPWNGELVTLWSRANYDSPAMGYARTTLESPTGQPLFEYQSEVDLTAHNRRRIRGKISVLPVPEDGLYFFRVFLRYEETANWDQVAEIPLEVTLEVEEN